MQPTQYAPPTQPTPRTDMAQATQPVQPERGYPAVRPQTSMVSTYRASQIIYLLMGIVEALIFLRVALKLLAADSGVGFVRFVYGLSAPLVAPFQGIFPTPASNSSVLELSSLVAIVVYALIGWGIVTIISIVGRRPIPTTAG